MKLKNGMQPRRRMRAGAIAASALAALFALFALTACADGAEPSSVQRSEEAGYASDVNDAPLSSDESSEPGTHEDLEEDDGTPIDRELLVSLIGEEETEKLIDGIATQPARQWIAAHPEAIDFEGDVVQAKLLKLAADEDEAVPFVRQFADRYPADAAEESEDSVSESGTRAPRLYQWDQRWGYTIYSSTAFGLTGCGPAAFAMVYQGVTGNRDMSPYDMGLLAQEMGHMAQFEGTDTSFLFDASSQLGMNCESISIDESALQQALDAGDLLIANMANGYFSHFSGHYIVLTGLDANGKLVINDPYSAVNSHQTWDTDFILGQTKGLYAFSA